MEKMTIAARIGLSGLGLLFLFFGLSIVGLFMWHNDALVSIDSNYSIPFTSSFTQSLFHISYMIGVLAGLLLLTAYAYSETLKRLKAKQK